MVHVDPDVAAGYREAWERWQAQLETMHAVFLEGQGLDPPRLKGLLNREAKAKDAYDEARLRLLGIPPG
jgi:hypothetical protein